MNTTTSEGQSLVDVALQEMGTVAALFDLADANGIGITDQLSAGQLLDVPNSAAADVLTTDYYASRAYRVNTGAEAPTLRPRRYDFNQTDFKPIDFS